MSKQSIKGKIIEKQEKCGHHSGWKPLGISTQLNAIDGYNDRVYHRGRGAVYCETCGYIMFKNIHDRD